MNNSRPFDSPVYSPNETLHMVMGITQAGMNVQHWPLVPPRFVFWPLV